MAHEIGHNWEIYHVLCQGDERGDDGRGNFDEDYLWPFPDCRLSARDPEGYYGFDVYWDYWAYLTAPQVISNDPAAAEPRRAFPLMGYKDPKWIDPFHYCKLLNAYGVECTLFGISP